MSDNTCSPEGHDGYTDSGQRGTNPTTGDQYEVWTCQCGTQNLQRYPNM